MIIDGSNLIMGRLASLVAKKALLGEDIVIVNCQDVIITGRKSDVLLKFQTTRARGSHSTGPFLHRNPERILKRVIRGMMPYKKPHGKEALKRVICHCDIPDSIKEQPVSIEGIDIRKKSIRHFIKVGEISKLLGAKI